MIKKLIKLRKFIDSTDIHTLECLGYALFSCVISSVLIGLVYFFG